jgi:ribonuclease HII
MAKLIPERVVAYGIGSVSAAEIDIIGLASALTLGATRALVDVAIVPDRIMLDGPSNYLPQSYEGDVVTYPKGDTRSSLIAAASILAKVDRDTSMVELSHEVPYFDFERNKGYPTHAHLRGLAAVGLSTFHRSSWSYAPKTLFRNPYLRAVGAAIGASASVEYREPDSGAARHPTSPL